MTVRENLPPWQLPERVGALAALSVDKSARQAVVNYAKLKVQDRHRPASSKAYRCWSLRGFATYRLP